MYKVASFEIPNFGDTAKTMNEELEKRNVDAGAIIDVIKQAGQGVCSDSLLVLYKVMIEQADANYRLSVLEIINDFKAKGSSSVEKYNPKAKVIITDGMNDYSILSIYNGETTDIVYIDIGKN